MQPYRELIQLTKQYLKEEFEPTEWLTTSPETCQFFRQLATQSKPAAKQAPTPQSKPAAKQTPPLQPKPTKMVRTLSKKKEAKPKPVEKEPPPKPPEPVALKTEKQDAPHDLKEQLDLIRQVCPKVNIIETIPEPRGPKKVVIICDQDPFWSKVGGALTDRGIDVHILPLDGEVSDADLVLLPRSAQRTIDKTPVIYTEETTLYQKDTYLKKVLWQSLCQQLGI